MPLGKLVISLNSKKIVLFIVEGVTDQISLDLILSKLIEKDKVVRFKIVNTDITTQRETNQSNILNKITDKIKESMEEGKYKKNDILRIVHIVDMDGAYIDDNMVIQKDVAKVEYTTECIYTNNAENIIKRNKQKSEILNKLCSNNTVFKNLPYKVYFFSCNLEHVLHNIQNATNDEKNNYSRMFSKRFKENPNKFIEFINDSTFALTGEYEETWNYIKQANNSLNRYTNFNLYFD